MLPLCPNLPAVIANAEVVVILVAEVAREPVSATVLADALIRAKVNAQAPVLHTVTVLVQVNALKHAPAHAIMVV